MSNLAWGDLFNALQTGVVEAEENPYLELDSGGFYQVQKYIDIVQNDLAKCIQIYLLRRNNNISVIQEFLFQLLIICFIIILISDYNMRFFNNEIGVRGGRMITANKPIYSPDDCRSSALV